MPHSGEVTLAIIRSGPVTTHTMDIWERETRLIKEFMGVAFQTGYLVLLFGEGHPRRYEGQHSGTHVSYTLNFDVQDGSQRAEGYYIRLFHETSHYYWRHGSRWFNEGAATFMEHVHAQKRQIQRVQHQPARHYDALHPRRRPGEIGTAEPGADA